MELERKNINAMTKAELKEELDNLRGECDRLKVHSDIVKLLDRMPTTADLKKIMDCAERVYRQSVVGDFYFLHGVHDNICDMADNLLDISDCKLLNYFSSFMYGVLLSDNPIAAENVQTMTEEMKEMLLNHMLEQKGEVA